MEWKTDIDNKDRRKYFDRGECPPELEASPSKALLQSRPLNAPSTPTASQTSSKRVSEPATRQPSNKLSKSAAALILSNRILSPKPPRTPPSLNPKSSQPSSLPAPVTNPARVAASKDLAPNIATPKPTELEIILIDGGDSHLLQERPPFNTQIFNQSPINSELMERSFIKSEPIDLDSHPTSSPAAVKRTPVRFIANGNTPSKRVKLESNDTAVPQSMEDAEEELRRMEEEDERDAEELRQRQRIADLLQARRERDARKVALLAKANHPTSPSS